MERREFLKSLAGGTVVLTTGLVGCKSLDSKDAKGSCAPCGKDCSACPAKLAGKCAGCRSKAADVSKAKCPIRSCTAKKGFKTCAECPGFPCAKVKAWAEKSDANKAAFNNLQNKCSK